MEGGRSDNVLRVLRSAKGCPWLFMRMCSSFLAGAFLFWVALFWLGHWLIDYGNALQVFGGKIRNFAGNRLKRIASEARAPSWACLGVVLGLYWG